MLKIILLLFSLNLFAQAKPNYEIVQIEGYYTSGWESSSFYEKRGDKIKKPMWLEFDKNFTWKDSLRKIVDEASLDGIFLKITGKKNENGNFGHLGFAKSMITVTEIIFVDPKNTMKKYFDEKNKR